jgi:hypothetical protein
VSSHQFRHQEPAPAQQESIISAESHENGVTFPLKVLPYPQYSGFFGRKETLGRIQAKLGLQEFPQREADNVRSVLLHGTGGVGKTQIARAYAHMNPDGFDATFWVRSDTEVNIKASFTTIALALNLRGAKQDAHDENWIYFTRWLSEQAASEKGMSLQLFLNLRSAYFE